MARKLISEQSILDASKRGEKTLLLSDGALVTDAARDRARQLGIKFVIKSADDKPKIQAAGAMETKPRAGAETVAIGSDHGGFALKEVLKPFIESRGYKVVDLGTYSEAACDYPDFAYAVGRMVALGSASKGVMIDAIGNASAIVANKIRGVRAAACVDEFSARSSREHNDANVLTLGGRILGTDLAKAIVHVWLETNFGGGRHLTRLKKIGDIESREK